MRQTKDPSYTISGDAFTRCPRGLYLSPAAWGCVLLYQDALA